MSQKCTDCIWYAEGECICNVWDMSTLCPKLAGNVDDDLNEDQEENHEGMDRTGH